MGQGDDRLNAWDAAVKVVFDRVVASVMLALLTPVLLLCALAVKCTSVTRPVLDTVPRLDRSGRVFGLHNFRVPSRSPLSRAFERLGLRHLPELVNVVRGEMSLVGPRPQAVHASAGPTAIRPGMTGLWVLWPTAERTPQQIAELNRSYVRTWSLRYDVGILMRSAAAVRYGSKSN